MRPLRRLPARPDLDQLRHQARDLLRAAAGGDPTSAERLRATAPRPTLAAAQLALAREYGFASWPRLKTEAQRRRALADAADTDAPALAGATPAAAVTPVALPHRYVIRPVDSPEELAATCDVIGAQVTPPLGHDDRRCADLVRHWPEDRSLMLLVEERSAAGTSTDGAQIAGGALAFRTGPRAVTLRMIGLEPRVRRLGLGRRLMAAVELAAIRLGVGQIALGTDHQAKGFYARLGYAGRGVMMHKGLPLPGRFLEARLRKLAGQAGGEVSA